MCGGQWDLNAFHQSSNNVKIWYHDACGVAGKEMKMNKSLHVFAPKSLNVHFHHTPYSKNNEWFTFRSTPSLPLITHPRYILTDTTVTLTFITTYLCDLHLILLILSYFPNISARYFFVKRSQIKSYYSSKIYNGLPLPVFFVWCVCMYTHNINTLAYIYLYMCMFRLYDVYICIYLYIYLYLYISFYLCLPYPAFVHCGISWGPFNYTMVELQVLSFTILLWTLLYQQ